MHWDAEVITYWNILYHGKGPAPGERNFQMLEKVVYNIAEELYKDGEMM